MAEFALDLKNIGHEGGERSLDVNIFLSAHFHEAPALFPSVLRPHVVRDFLVGQVHLVPNQDHNDALLGVVLYLLAPGLQGEEGVAARHVVDEEGCDGLAEKDWRKRFKPFLPQGVPDMQLCNVLRIPYHHVLALELDLS